MSKNRPNILFLMVDQMQAQAIEPQSLCKTPNLVKLGQQGTRFSRAYTPSAVCIPSRTSLMTGLLPHNHGLHHTADTTGKDGGLKKENPHWAQKLREAGYHTGYFGKWPVGNTENTSKWGWQEFKGKKELDLSEPKELTNAYYHSNPGYKHSPLYGVTDEPIEKRNVYKLSQAAIEFLNSAATKDDPWCCFVSSPKPHDPFICGKEAHALYNKADIKLPENAEDDLSDKPGLYRKVSKVWADITDDQRKQAIMCYYGCISEVDQCYGMILDKLRELGQFENTIIIFTSDHGELLGAHKLYTKNVGAFEEVYNIPFVIAGKNVEPGKVSSARVGLHDLAPTLMEMVKLDWRKKEDSTSFAPLLRGETSDEQYSFGFSEFFGGRFARINQRIVWEDNWKFVCNGFDIDEFYDLKNDPHEMNNLAGNPAYNETLKLMCNLMWNKIAATGDKELLDSQYPSLRLAPIGPDGA